MRLKLLAFPRFIFFTLLVMLIIMGISSPLFSQNINRSPLPPAAQGPAIPRDKGYLVEKIGDRLYRVADGTDSLNQ
ncbi:hypothetical protein [Floridanema evergladense]|uniref:Uncharacterized protein n=1 Tax=Floridaenema evergladense BLCC-F167 TaxID=3153639 RepID=A0ABV4WFL2_9CYAN